VPRQWVSCPSPKWWCTAAVMVQASKPMEPRTPPRTEPPAPGQPGEAQLGEALLGVAQRGVQLARLQPGQAQPARAQPARAQPARAQPARAPPTGVQAVTLPSGAVADKAQLDKAQCCVPPGHPLHRMHLPIHHHGQDLLRLRVVIHLARCLLHGNLPHQDLHHLIVCTPRPKAMSS
jgi:hypothetical protein